MVDALCCAHWLNWKCGVSTTAAREQVRVARALRELPQIRDAFARGIISYSKVRAMTRVATPASEEYLLMRAERGEDIPGEPPRPSFAALRADALLRLVDGEQADTELVVHASAEIAPGEAWGRGMTCRA